MNPKTMTDEELLQFFGMGFEKSLSDLDGVDNFEEIKQEILRRMSAGVEERKP